MLVAGRCARRRGSRFVVGALSLLVLGACAPAESASSAVPPSVVVPSPAGVMDPAPTGPAAPDPDCDPYPSPRPTAESGDDNTVSRIRERGRLIVGVSQSTPLFSYRNPSTGALEGFDIDMAREIARAIIGEPDRISYRVVPSSKRVDALVAGEVDLVASLMTATCDRQGDVLFSASYFDSGLRVMARRDAGITALDDLGDRRACTAQGSTAVLAIEALDQRLRAADERIAVLHRRVTDAEAARDRYREQLDRLNMGRQRLADELDDRPAAVPVGPDVWTGLRERVAADPAAVATPTLAALAAGPGPLSARDGSRLRRWLRSLTRSGQASDAGA